MGFVLELPLEWAWHVQKAGDGLCKSGSERGGRRKLALEWPPPDGSVRQPLGGKWVEVECRQLLGLGVDVSAEVECLGLKWMMEGKEKRGEGRCQVEEKGKEDEGRGLVCGKKGK